MGEWLTYKEASELAGVSESTMRRVVKAHEIAVFVRGKNRVVMRKEDVLSWMEPRLRPDDGHVTPLFERTVRLADRHNGDCSGLPVARAAIVDPQPALPLPSDGWITPARCDT